jgi:hypothetical protein
MRSNKTKSISYPGDIWVISRGKYIDSDSVGIDKGIRTGAEREYRISDLAKYLLDPNPIEIEKKLVGCEAHYHQSLANRLRERMGQMLPQKLQGRLKNDSAPPELIMADCDTKTPALKDRSLEAHFSKISELLRPYDPVLNKLSGLDTSKISEIMGICKDILGNPSKLNIMGSIEDKISYIEKFISQDVRIVLEKAYISDGLFEMRGFDFEFYDPRNAHRLIKFLQDGKPKYCVLNYYDEVEYCIDDIELIRYMHLLEQSIRTNPKLHTALKLCSQGHAKPLRLYFSKQLEIDYSQMNLPKIYREVFQTYDMGLAERNAILSYLNSLQFVISFNYVPQSNSAEEKLFTNISVMHDLKALEPIKDNLPHLYSEINKRAVVSEAGKFYLLDSIRGYKDV